VTGTFDLDLLTWLHFEKGCSLRTLKITDHADIGNWARHLDLDKAE